MAVGGWLWLSSCWVLALMCCQPLVGASRLQRGLLELNSNKPLHGLGFMGLTRATALDIPMNPLQAVAYPPRKELQKLRRCILSDSYQGAYQGQIIRATLIHRDHPESPLSVPGAISAGDRYLASVSRQNARLGGRQLQQVALEFHTPISAALAEGLEEYIMMLYLGTPAQKFFLIVDTGSDLVWVQCLPCIKCFNETHPFFDPAASSSYSAVPCSSPTCNQTELAAGQALCNSLKNCHITYAYAQRGSYIAGELSTETLSFDNSIEGQLGISNFLFGCMNNDTIDVGLTDGIVGFARGHFSLPSQLSTLTSTKVFSYCLVPYIVSATLTSPLVFGVSNNNTLQLAYTPILNVESHLYWVNITGISINGIDVSIPTTSLEYNSSTNSGGSVFDSGTNTIIFADQDVWRIVVEKFQILITYPLVQLSNTTICYNVSEVQQPTYPNMTIHFSGLHGTIVDFPLSGLNLFIPVSDDVECLAIVPSEGIVDVNIIGNIAQADHYIEIDAVNMKIGWTSRDCSLPM